MMKHLTLVVVALLLPGSAALADEGGQWSDLPSMTTPRQEVGAALLDGKAYVIAGFLADLPIRPTDEVERYDLATELWEPVPPLPAALHHVAATEVNGRVHVLGGLDAQSNSVATNYIYDPGTNQWTTGPPMPKARGACWAVTHLGKIYVFGGRDSTVPEVTPSTFIYDATTGQWSQGADMPTPREHLNAVTAGPFIYVMAGRDESGSLTANERYNPASNSWKTMAPVPTARSALLLARLGTKIYAAGGEVPGIHAANEVYDLSTNSWDCDEDMQLPRHGIAAIPLDDRFLAPGGGTDRGLEPTNRMDAFVPEDTLITVTANPAVPVVGQPYGLTADIKNPFDAFTGTLTFFYLVNGTPIRMQSRGGVAVGTDACIEDLALVNLQSFPNVPEGILVTLLVDESDGRIVSLHSLEIRPGS